jgi:hypothetical protein
MPSLPFFPYNCNSSFAADGPTLPISTVVLTCQNVKIDATCPTNAAPKSMAKKIRILMEFQIPVVIKKDKIVDKGFLETWEKITFGLEFLLMGAWKSYNNGWEMILYP